MEQVYGGYTRSPWMTKGNKGTGGDDRPHRNAGQIDFYAYGGKPSSDYNDQRYAYYRDSKYYKPGKASSFYESHEDRNRNRDKWSEIAKHLGIKKVDGEDDLRRMYDFVSGYKKEESKPDDTTETETDYTLQPRGTRVPYGNRSLGQAPRFSGGSGSSARSGTGDGSMSAIRAGDDLNEWYQTKFVPHLEADANATNSEIGDDSRYFLKNFVFSPPKLGNIKDIFDRYKGEIEDLD